jgi:hypothetical protein
MLRSRAQVQKGGQAARRKAAPRSELLVASGHVPDRVGEPAGDFDLDDLGPALLSDPPAGALLSAPVLSFAGCDSGSTRPPAAEPVEAPEAETLRGCRTAVYGEIRPGVREDAVGAGPLALLLVDSERRAAFEPSAVVKVLALVRAGETATLVVPQAERRRLSLLYDFDSPGPRRPLRLSDGTSSVRFRACTEYEEWSPGHPYPDPRETLQRRLLRSRRPLRPARGLGRGTGGAPAIRAPFRHRRPAMSAEWASLELAPNPSSGASATPAAPRVALAPGSRLGRRARRPRLSRP